MDAEDALRLLASHDEERHAAEAALTDRYLPALLVRLQRKYMDFAGVVAGGALMRLFAFVRRNPGRVNSGSIDAWLLRASWFAARDERRKLRGRQQASIEPLSDHEEPAQATEPLPRASAEGAELARAVLEFIMSFDQPDRGILLFDVIDEIDYMLDDELDLRDEELIDVTRPWGTHTRNALRSRRSRIRARLRQFLAERGFE